MGLSWIDRAQANKAQVIWEGVVSRIALTQKNRRKVLTDLGAFDTSTRVVLTDYNAPSSGAVSCSIQIPGLGLVDPS